MTILFDTVSDLHVDSWAGRTQHHISGTRFKDDSGRPMHIDWRVVKNEGSRVLVIAGDTSNSIPETALVAEQAAQEYDHVVVVLGNHEFYRSKLTFPETEEKANELFAHLSNVTLLSDKKHTIIDGVMFLGCTGWYDWKCYADRVFNPIPEIEAKEAWGRFMWDRKIQFIDGCNPPEVAERHRLYLQDMVRQANENDMIEKIVIVTHMVPEVALAHWNYQDMNWNRLTPSFVCTNALKMAKDVDMNKKLAYWIYGHTHYASDKTIDGTVLLNSARGYPGENSTWVIPQLEV